MLDSEPREWHCLPFFLVEKGRWKSPWIDGTLGFGCRLPYRAFSQFGAYDADGKKAQTDKGLNCGVMMA